MDRPLLLTPCTIGPLRLKNRIVMAPMTTLLEYAGDGRYEEFYLARGAGGTALVVLNLQALWPGSRAAAGDTTVLALNHDRYVPRLGRLVEALHRQGCAVGAQLSCGPFWAPDETPGGLVALSPSGLIPHPPAFRPDAARMPFFPGGPPTPSATLAGVPAAVAAAARRAVAAGVDAVQVAASGVTVLAQFLSPLLNRRSDLYGVTLRGRARLTLDTLSAVRATVGSLVAVTCRINGDDLVVGGMDADDYARLVPDLEDAGAQAIDIMPGGLISPVPVNEPGVPWGHFLPLAGAIRRAARVPVMAGTRVGMPDVAKHAIGAGMADLVSLGTPLIVDAEWVNKLEQGRAGTIRPCTACQECWNDLMERHRPIRCPEHVINPA